MTYQSKYQYPISDLEIGNLLSCMLWSVLCRVCVVTCTCDVATLLAPLRARGLSRLSR